MSIADKLLVVVENIPKVYEAGRKAGGDYDTAYNEGYDNGYAKGETDGYNNGYIDGVASVPNPLEYVSKGISLNSAYQDAVFPENYELTIECPKFTNMTYAFQRATGITKLTLKGHENGPAIAFNSAFANTPIVILDITEFNMKIQNASSMCANCSALKEVRGVLDFSEATSLSVPFASCTELEEVRLLANSLSLSLNISKSSKLSAESVQSIFDGLATVEVAQTLTLNEDVKILQSQVDSANAKGWTVAGGTVVSEEEYYG